MLRSLVVLSLLSLIAACAPVTPTPTSTPLSPWSDPVTLGRAQQGDPPVIWPQFGGIAASWASADEAGVHENAIRFSNGVLSAVTVLPLPPRHPYALSGAPASNGDLHLLWLDADTSGETHLFSALLSSQLTVERGPTPISERAALRYAVIPAENGSVWTAWSGDLAAEPSLYAQPIDADGRPRPSKRIATDATEPALTRAEDGTVTVYWLGASDGQVYRATVGENGAGPIQALTASVRLEAADQLDSLRAGLDRTYAYLFWNVTRADGSVEVWLASGALAQSEWAQPRRLLLTQGGAAVATSWGQVASASASGAPVRRVGPLAGQRDWLPVAAQTDRGLEMLYFQDGKLIGAEPVTEAVGLLAAPGLTTDANSGLVVSWAEPDDDGYASLKVTIKPLSSRD